METSQLHTLRFYPKDLNRILNPRYSHIAAPTLEEYLTKTTANLFQIPLSDFAPVEKTTIAKRRIQSGYTYRNMLLIGISYFKGEPRVNFEVNGSAFDHLQLDLDQLFAAVSSGFVITEIHAALDTTAVPFAQLWKCFRNSSVTSNAKRRCDYESTSKTLYFGCNDKVLCVYESGLYHDLQERDTVRFELRYTGEQARYFWEHFRADEADLSALIKGHVKSTFDVNFRRITKDPNVSRRPTLPVWERFLADSKETYKRYSTKPSQVKNLMDCTIAYMERIARQASPEELQGIMEALNSRFLNRSLEAIN
ncbi:MAG: replication initiation factor domain-containing protein [Geobacter sp.]|nr:replication initiation factor domain-containing protein [Geobacter sp.]